MSKGLMPITLGCSTFIPTMVDMVKYHPIDDFFMSYIPLPNTYIYLAGDQNYGDFRSVGPALAEVAIAAFEACGLFRRYGTVLINDFRVAGWDDHRNAAIGEQHILVRFAGGGTFTLRSEDADAFLAGFPAARAASVADDSP